MPYDDTCGVRVPDALVRCCASLAFVELRQRDKVSLGRVKSLTLGVLTTYGQNYGRYSRIYPDETLNQPSRRVKMTAKPQEDIISIGCNTDPVKILPGKQAVVASRQRYVTSKASHFFLVIFQRAIKQFVRLHTCSKLRIAPSLHHPLGHSLNQIMMKKSPLPHLWKRQLSQVLPRFTFF